MTPTPARPVAVRTWLVVCLALAAYVGFGAVSVAWLGDWGEHGPTFARRYGQMQTDALALALACGVCVWLVRDHAMHVALRLLTRWTGLPAGWRIALGVGAMVTAVAAIAALHWAHKLHTWPGLPLPLRPYAEAVARAALASGYFPIRSALTVELLRLPGCMLLAWCTYRWRHAGLSLPAHLGLATAVVATLGLGLWASQDKGPMLVIALSAAVLSGGVARQLLPSPQRERFAGWLLMLAASGLGIAALLAALPHVTPADRLAAWREPYASRLEYLAQVTWFMQAAGSSGFGLGQTPWCGYTGAVLGRCLGMPTETQSDYTLAALAGLWGPVVAWALVAASALWLLTLLWLAARAPRPRHGIDAAGLAASAGALYVLMLLAQLFVTSLGNLGVLPLTGVTMPMLSWGRASLVSTTVALALVLPRWTPGMANTDMGRLWLDVARAAWAAAAVGLALVAWGLAQRLGDAAPDRLPQGRINPWLPVDACILSAAGGPLLGLPLPAGWQEAICPHEEGQPPGAALPADEPLRRALARLGRQQPADLLIARGGLRIPRRAEVLTTIDADLQQRADRLAACLTGAGGAHCATLVPPALQARYALRHEGAAVRAISSVTLRLSDGALVAATHARSACSEAQMSNGPRPAHCPPEAARALPRPGRLAHQALRADDMVSSTLKPLLADALLSAPGGQRWLSGAPREQMLTALAKSDTAFFIDHLLCFVPGGDPLRCTGPAVLASRVQQMALAQPFDLLAAADAAPHAPRLAIAGLALDIPTWPPTGRRADAELAAAWNCHDRPAEQRWRACDGEQLAALVAPLWGQGGARSNPLAVAHLYLRLVAAARGATQAPAPHLLGYQGIKGPAGFEQAHAELILEGLRRTPLVGTARGACVSVRGSAGCQGLSLAMKTGTSLFPHHDLTVAQRAAQCSKAFDAEDRLNRDGTTIPAALRKASVQCALYPFKWAVLIEPTSEGDDALLSVVLVERNTLQGSGRLDADDDRGPNVAAEAALLLHAERLQAPRREN